MPLTRLHVVAANGRGKDRSVPFPGHAVGCAVTSQPAPGRPVARETFCQERCFCLPCRCLTLARHELGSGVQRPACPPFRSRHHCLTPARLRLRAGARPPPPGGALSFSFSSISFTSVSYPWRTASSSPDLIVPRPVCWQRDMTSRGAVSDRRVVQARPRCHTWARPPRRERQRPGRARPPGRSPASPAAGH